MCTYAGSRTGVSDFRRALVSEAERLMIGLGDGETCFSPFKSCTPTKMEVMERIGGDEKHEQGGYLLYLKQKREPAKTS